MKKLFIVCILILAFTFGVFVGYYRFNTTSNIVEIANINNENQSEDVVEEVIPEDITINMTVAGDILCHNTNFWDAYVAELDDYDFSYSFEDVKKYFDNADVAIGVLETNFAGRDIGYTNYPLFNSPEHLATDLKELGFDILGTANNHCLDKGFSGMVSTLEELDKAGIDHMGTYATEEDSKEYLIKDVKGIKMAFLTYTYGTNGIPIPTGKEFSVNITDKEKILADLENVKKENVDVICVNMHWGDEYSLKPNSNQKDLADFLFENGVDLILGSHTHCLEPMEKRTITMEDGTTKDGFIIYSLGNFMSGQKHENSRQSVILDIQLTKNGETNKISVDSVTYTPIYMYNFYQSGVLQRFKIMDIEAEIEKYESGDTSIGASMYQTLKSELVNVYEVVGEEILPEKISKEEGEK
ncbi:MAG: CapA family protein [Clostridia bacterium]|jgi:poly-gamma-glutamate capsule biosynthesis protein CapA/YwtB (metallophosphatase superfamily)|nr:CapA family protein [Clostridia bacterium]